MYEIPLTKAELALIINSLTDSSVALARKARASKNRSVEKAYEDLGGEVRDLLKKLEEI